jgi:hypothetical protein
MFFIYLGFHISFDQEEDKESVNVHDIAKWVRLYKIVCAVFTIHCIVLNFTRLKFFCNGQVENNGNYFNGNKFDKDANLLKIVYKLLVFV